MTLYTKSRFFSATLALYIIYTDTYTTITRYSIAKILAEINVIEVSYEVSYNYITTNIVAISRVAKAYYEVDLISSKRLLRLRPSILIRFNNFLILNS